MNIIVLLEKVHMGLYVISCMVGDAGIREDAYPFVTSVNLPAVAHIYVSEKNNLFRVLP